MTRAERPIDDVLAACAAQAVRLWPENGRLHYRSPTPPSVALQEAIRTHKSGLLTRLAAWDGPEALRLEAEADGVVSGAGVPGDDAMIAAGAARCVEAHYRHDMGGVRAACARIEERVRHMAAGSKARDRGSRNR